MRLDLEGTTILVTGASSGIGREFARQLADRAAVLVLVARRTERLRELAAELGAANARLRVVLLPCDLGDRRATDEMLARLEAEVGEVDVVINNAGLGDFGVFDGSPWA
jgi:short-subunit dehydrogenase